MDIQKQATMTANEMIAEAIRERGLTQKQFSVLVGKKPANISTQLHSGYMRAEEWRTYAKALGYNVVMVPIERE